MIVETPKSRAYTFSLGISTVGRQQNDLGFPRLGDLIFVRLLRFILPSRRVLPKLICGFLGNRCRNGKVNVPPAAVARAGAIPLGYDPTLVPLERCKPKNEVAAQ